MKTREERIADFYAMIQSRCYANGCDIAEDIIKELQEENKKWHDQYQSLSKRLDDQANESIDLMQKNKKLKEENRKLKEEVGYFKQISEIKENSIKNLQKIIDIKDDVIASLRQLNKEE